jgi:hypothetical protein
VFGLKMVGAAPIMKNFILAVSLAVNALALYIVFNPGVIPGPKMTCKQSTSEDANKRATSAFSKETGGSFIKVHEYLRASDYQLRNIAVADGSVTFAYTANTYPSTCGWLMPGIDTTIVRVRTDLAVEPKVTAVY